jgi:hypothetical protein
MKIAPLTERWNEGERDWSFVKDPRADIEAWEKAEGILLPESYRKFMLRYNGGRVYPRLFRTKAEIGHMMGPYVCQDEETFCEVIYDWAFVERIYTGKYYAKGVPPKHIAFASAPMRIELLMALNSKNYGRIYAWIRSTNDWGTDGNDEIFPLARSFPEFLLNLYDDKKKSDYSNWRVPIYDILAKDIEL